jgi:O-antigen/teichoic acid export membrane protein
MAQEIALLPASKISAVVNMLSSLVMAELQRNIDAMRAAFFRAVRLTATIALPTAAGMALVAEDLVGALLGPKWLPAAPVLRVLCAYAAVRAIDVVLPPVLFARRRERFLFWYCLVLLIFVPTAAVFGALWKGALGTVFLATPVYCAVMLIMAREALAELEAGFFELCSALWPVLAATAAMTVAVLPLREFALEGWAEGTLVRLLVLSSAGALDYGAVLLVIGRPLIAEAIEVVSWILGRGRTGHL